MIVRRSLKLPGAREYESSGFDVELDSKDYIGPGPHTTEVIQETLHRMMRDAQLHVLLHAVADGVMLPDEFSKRWTAFQSGLPSWVKDIK